jgi:hypothetical protein
MDDILFSLLSGLIGAVIATILTIIYTEYNSKRDKKFSLAREKLEKVYAPLVALKKKLDEVNQNDHALILPSNPMEKELIEKIIFHYYHLVDDDLKEGIIMLHPDISRNTMSVMKNVQSNVTEKIMKHYNENKKVLGLK